MSDDSRRDLKGVPLGGDLIKLGEAWLQANRGDDPQAVFALTMLTEIRATVHLQFVR